MDPLLEWPKFLSALFSNLHEFLLVRMGRLQQQSGAETSPDCVSA
ncbi:MAG: hypothetical protein JO217_00630 [Acidobacteriaceae bacterium]|nr:hypothetical protein [Acidobacteriaceae bacterium]MBV9441173.1 hypothetical protein [Acidobacteriaceae bacterium]